MNDTISRKEVLQFIEDMKVVAPNHNIISETVMAVIKCVRRFVTAMPSVDAIPVVRCRECVYWKPSKLFPEENRMVCTYVIGATYARESGDFCSRGERREDGDT